MTFSLVGRCERTGAVGAVIASASMAVAARCAAVRAGAGAVCSQSTTDPRLREALLDAMAGGATAGHALARLAGRTADLAWRQLAAVDAAGGSAAYSGERALGQAADVHAPGAAAAGNLLATPDVPAAMLAAFQDAASQSLGDRLIAGLRAGLAAGGEVTPVRSAGLLIAESVPWPVTDLRVDWHDEPVAQLARLWQLWQPQAGSYVQRALRPAGATALCAARPARLTAGVPAHLEAFVVMPAGLLDQAIAEDGQRPGLRQQRLVVRAAADHSPGEQPGLWSAAQASDHGRFPRGGAETCRVLAVSWVAADFEGPSGTAAKEADRDINGQQEPADYRRSAG